MFNLTSNLRSLHNKLFRKSSVTSQSSINRNAFHIGLLFTLSRLIGAIREAAISRFVELNVYDMYTLASKLPSMIRRLSSEGSLEHAYVPSLAKFPKDSESMEASHWITGIASTIVTFSLIIVYFFVITSQTWVKILLKKTINPYNIVIFTDLFTIMLPMILLYFLSSTCISILHRYERFIHANIGQSIANVFMVLTVVIGYSLFDSYYVLALCVVIGAAVHMAWQYYGARKLSREVLGKRYIFPDRIADVLVTTMASIILCYGIMLILNQVYKILIPIPILQWMAVALITCAAVFLACIFEMRKKVQDKSLEYGSILSSTKSNSFIVYSYYLLIFVSIIQNVSCFTRFTSQIYYLNTILIVNIVAYYIYIFFKCKSKFHAWTWLKHWSKGKTVLTYSVLSLFAIFGKSLIAKHILVLCLMIDQLVVLYIANFASDKLSDKVKLINKDFLKISRNAFFGTGINQIMSFVSIAVSAQLGPGAPSYLARADRIMQFPIGILGVSFGVALLPRVSRLIAEGKSNEAQSSYNQAIMLNLGLCIIAIIISLLLAQSLARLFLGGKTTHKDIKVICDLFKIQLLALPSSIIIKTLSPIYFSTDQSMIITNGAIVQCVVDVLLKISIVTFDLGIYAMGLTWVVGSWANAIYLLNRSSKFIDPLGPLRLIKRSIK